MTFADSAVRSPREQNVEPRPLTVSFEGIPTAAFDFYDDLETENTKAFWDNNKEVYRTAIKEPMTALATDLADEFGEAKLFRPNRDVRFAKDKSPYKTHQGLYVPVGPATGWYAEVSAAGFRVGVGFYDATADRLARIRTAIDAPAGAQLATIVDLLVSGGWELGGDRVKTTPRGYTADHPRIDLLRHRTMSLGRSYGFDEVIQTSALLEKVRADWRAGKPFLDWLDRHGS